MRKFIKVFELLLVLSGVGLSIWGGQNLTKYLTASIFSAPSGSTDATSGLVGYWDMNLDGGADGTVYDNSRYSNDGTNNGATPIEGKIGSALYFDNNDWTTHSDADALDVGTSDFSISLWLKSDFSSYPTDINNGGGEGFLQKKTGGYPFCTVEEGYILFAQDTNFRFWLANGEGSCPVQLSVAANTYIYDQAWHHVVITIDRDGSAIMYIDNVARNTDAVVNDNNDISNGSGLNLGRMHSIGFSDKYFNGILDEVRIYNHVLTTDEITTLYNEGTNQGTVVLNSHADPDEGLVGWWPLSSGTHQPRDLLSSAGDFESWTAGVPDGWTDVQEAANSTITQDMDNARSGVSSLSITVDGSSNAAGVRKSGLTFAPGKDYRITLWAKRTTANGGFYIRTHFDDNTGSLNYNNTLTNVGATWQKYTFNFTAGANDNGLSFWRHASYQNTVTLIDDVRIYDLDGGLVQDLSTGGNAGTITPGSSSGFVADSHGNSGEAYDFDGADTTIPTTLTSNDDFLNGFTISAWIKAESAGEGGNGRVVDKAESNIAINGFRYYLESSQVYFGINEGATIGSGANTVPSNVWNHILVTVASDATITHYINGAQSGLPSTTNVLSGITTANSLTIGNFAGAASRTFDGSISDVRIYNRVLSPTEITELYNSYSPRMKSSSHTKGLAGHWPLTLGESNGSTVKDLGSGDNDGTASNVTIGGRMSDFNGTTSSIDLGSDVIGTGADTISAWINLDSLGENSGGRIVDNGKTFFYLSNAPDTNSLAFRSDGTNYALAAAEAVSLNQWIHVTATRDASGVANIYVNGVLSGDADQDSGTPTAGDNNVFIGNNSAGDRTMAGKIADVKHWDRELSATEVLQLYEQGRPKSESNYAANFNGSSQYFTLADSGSAGSAEDFDLNDDDFMIEMWVQGQGAGQIISKKGPQDDGYDLNPHSGLANYIITIDGDTDDSQSVGAGSAYSDTGWKHLVIIGDRDQNTGAKLYFNGTSVLQSSGFASVGSVANAYQLAFGRRADAAAGYWNGKLAHARIYKFGEGGMPSNIVSLLQSNATEMGKIDPELAPYLVDGWDFNGDGFALKDSRHDLTNNGSTPFVKVR